MDLKNPSRTLTNEQIGEKTQIPPEFIAAMNIVETVIRVPNEVLPDPTSDVVIFSLCQTDRTNEREKRTFFKKPGNIVLNDIRTTDQGQGVQIVRTLYRTDDAVPPVPNAVSNVAVRDLGNGWSIQEVSTEGSYIGGVFVPGIFSGNRFELSRPDTVPDEFKVAIPTTTLDTNVIKQAQLPILLEGDLNKAEEQIDTYVTRLHSVNRPASALGQELISKETTEAKQVATVTKLYKLVGNDAVPGPVKDVTVQNLGDGRVVETSKTVPTLFLRKAFEVTRPDTVPEKFKVAIPAETTETSVQNEQAVMPTLLGGDLQRSEEQLDAFNKRTRVTTRPPADLGKTLISLRTNEQKQVVTDTQEYKLIGNNTAPTAKLDVDVQNLGDGRVIETRSSILEVFGAKKFVESISDNIPAEFQGLVQRNETRFRDTLLPAAERTLASGEIYHGEEQLDLFVREVTSVKRDTVAAGELLDRSFDGPTDGEGTKFTGSALRTKKLAFTALLPEMNLTTFESKVENLGANTYVRESKELDNGFPTLFDAEYNPRTGLKVVHSKTIVPAATALPLGNVRHKVLDSQRKLQVTDTISIPDEASLYQKFNGKIDVQLPTQLISVKGVANPTANAGSHTTIQNSYSIGSDRGSGSIGTRGQASVMAAVAVDISYDVNEPWGQNVPCKHWLFAQPRSNVTLRGGFEISMWNFRFGPGGTLEQNAFTLLAWPKFAPKTALVTCLGGRLGITREGQYDVTESVRLDYNGVVKGNGNAVMSGVGGTVEGEVVTKIIRLPPTIHPPLTITQPSSADLHPFASAIGNLNGSVPLGCRVDILNSGITPLVIPGTPGQQTIPTTGTYLYKFFVEPYDFDYMLLHFITINFADIL